MLDGAHNPAAIRALAGALTSGFKSKRMILVIGVMEDKEIGRLIRETIKSINGVQLTKTAIVMSTYKETAQFPIDDGVKTS